MNLPPPDPTTLYTLAGCRALLRGSSPLFAHLPDDELDKLARHFYLAHLCKSVPHDVAAKRAKDADLKDVYNVVCRGLDQRAGPV